MNLTTAFGVCSCSHERYASIIHIDNSVYELYNNWVIQKTTGQSIISPEVLPYEIGNALIAMQRKGRLNNREILRAVALSQRIAVRFISVNIYEAIKIAMRFKIYAYDAYYLQCCIESKLPLISLDGRMCKIAKSLGINVVE